MEIYLLELFGKCNFGIMEIGVRGIRKCFVFFGRFSVSFLRAATGYGL